MWKLFIMSALVGFVGKRFFKMSNVWIYTCYIPLALLYVNDKKNAPLDEIENFYKYALELRKTQALYNSSKEAVVEALSKVDSTYVETIKKDLSKSNKTLFEVVCGIDAELLRLVPRQVIV